MIKSDGNLQRKREDQLIQSIEAPEVCSRKEFEALFYKLTAGMGEYQKKMLVDKLLESVEARLTRETTRPAL